MRLFVSQASRICILLYTTTLGRNHFTVLLRFQGVSSVWCRLRSWCDFSQRSLAGLYGASTIVFRAAPAGTRAESVPLQTTTTQWRTIIVYSCILGSGNGRLLLIRPTLPTHPVSLDKALVWAR